MCEVGAAEVLFAELARNHAETVTMSYVSAFPYRLNRCGAARAYFQFGQAQPLHVLEQAPSERLR